MKSNKQCFHSLPFTKRKEIVETFQACQYGIFELCLTSIISNIQKKLSPFMDPIGVPFFNLLHVITSFILIYLINICCTY